MSDSPRLRVAFSIGSLYGGGSERQLVQNLCHLDRQKFEPFLYLIYREGDLLDQVPADVPVAAFADRTRLPKLYWPGRMHGRRVRDFTGFLREQRIDVAYDRTFHMSLIAAPATRAARVPRLSTIVTDPRRDFESIAGRFQGMKRHLLRRAYATADRVLTVSNGVADAAAEFYRLPRQSFRTVYNSIDVARIDQTIKQAANPFVSTPDRMHLVAAGRLHHQKGFDILIRAVAELVHRGGRDRLVVHVLGDGPERESLVQLADACDVTKHVVMEGYRRDAAAWFHHADAFVLSSRYEGMPNALMEAMAAGVPVIAADCPSGPAEILENGSLGALVPPEDPTALAAAIGGLLDYRDAFLARSEKARRFIEQTFALPRSVRHLEELLIESTA